MVEEHGAPSWFELHSLAYPGALSFYRDAFGFDVIPISDNDQFRYSVWQRPGEETELAGVCDDQGVLPEGETSHWAIYWEVDDVDDAVGAVSRLGGTVYRGPDDSPYGRIAVVADPQGAKFMLRTRPRP